MFEKSSYYQAKIPALRDQDPNASRAQQAKQSGGRLVSLPAALSLGIARRDHADLVKQHTTLQQDLNRAHQQVQYLSCVPAGESMNSSLWHNDVVKQIHDYKVTSFAIKSKFAGLKTLDNLPGSIIEYDRMLTAFKEGIPYVPLGAEAKKVKTDDETDKAFQDEPASDLTSMLAIAQKARQDHLDTMEFDEAMEEIEGPEARAERLLQVAVSELTNVSRGEDAKLRVLVTEMCADMMRDVEEIADALLKEKMRADRDQEKKMRDFRSKQRDSEKAERARLKKEREAARMKLLAQEGLAASMAASKANEAQEAEKERIRKAKETAMGLKKAEKEQRAQRRAAREAEKAAKAAAKKKEEDAKKKPKDKAKDALKTAALLAKSGFAGKPKEDDKKKKKKKDDGDDWETKSTASRSSSKSGKSTKSQKLKKKDKGDDWETKSSKSTKSDKITDKRRASMMSLDSEIAKKKKKKEDDWETKSGVSSKSSSKRDKRKSSRMSLDDDDTKSVMSSKSGKSDKRRSSQMSLGSEGGDKKKKKKAEDDDDTKSVMSSRSGKSSKSSKAKDKRKSSQMSLGSEGEKKKKKEKGEDFDDSKSVRSSKSSKDGSKRKKKAGSEGRHEASDPFEPKEDLDFLAEALVTTDSGGFGSAREELSSAEGKRDAKALVGVKGLMAVKGEGRGAGMHPVDLMPDDDDLDSEQLDELEKSRGDSGGEESDSDSESEAGDSDEESESESEDEVDRKNVNNKAPQQASSASSSTVTKTAQQSAATHNQIAAYSNFGGLAASSSSTVASSPGAKFIPGAAGLFHKGKRLTNLVNVLPNIHNNLHKVFYQHGHHHAAAGPTPDQSAALSARGDPIGGGGDLKMGDLGVGTKDGEEEDDEEVPMPTFVPKDVDGLKKPAKAPTSAFSEEDLDDVDSRRLIRIASDISEQSYLSDTDSSIDFEENLFDESGNLAAAGQTMAGMNQAGGIQRTNSGMFGAVQQVQQIQYVLPPAPPKSEMWTYIDNEAAALKKAGLPTELEPGDTAPMEIPIPPDQQCSLCGTLKLGARSSLKIMALLKQSSLRESYLRELLAAGLRLGYVQKRELDIWREKGKQLEGSKHEALKKYETEVRESVEQEKQDLRDEAARIQKDLDLEKLGRQFDRFMSRKAMSQMERKFVDLSAEKSIRIRELEEELRKYEDQKTWRERCATEKNERIDIRWQEACPPPSVLKRLGTMEKLELGLTRRNSFDLNGPPDEDGKKRKKKGSNSRGKKNRRGSDAGAGSESDEEKKDDKKLPTNTAAPPVKNKEEEEAELLKKKAEEEAAKKAAEEAAKPKKKGWFGGKKKKGDEPATPTAADNKEKEGDDVMNQILGTDSKASAEVKAAVDAAAFLGTDATDVSGTEAASGSRGAESPASPAGAQKKGWFGKKKPPTQAAAAEAAAADAVRESQEVTAGSGAEGGASGTETAAEPVKKKGLFGRKK